MAQGGRRIGHTDVRKYIATKMQELAPEMGKTVAKAISHSRQTTKRSYIHSELTKVASEAMSIIASVTQPQCDVMSLSAGASNLFPGTPQKSRSRVIIDQLKRPWDSYDDGIDGSGGADKWEDDVGTQSCRLPTALQEKVTTAFSKTIREGRSLTSEHVLEVLMKKDQDLRSMADHPEEMKHVVDFLRYTTKKCLP